jgi:hyperosmotically inducible protein
MKKITLLTFAAIFAMAFIGCESTKETNSNHAVVVNSSTNANAAMNSNLMNSNIANTNNATGIGTTNGNMNLTREEYNKEKDKYASEAKASGSTIGQGVDDGWLWTKTRAELTATADLRARTINVDVNNAIVTLRGTVASKEQADKAVSVAKGVSGVKEVKNMLKVDPNDSLTNQMTSGNTNTKTTTTNANTKH